jgi:hypothetical protein
LIKPCQQLINLLTEGLLYRIAQFCKRERKFNLGFLIAVVGVRKLLNRERKTNSGNSGNAVKGNTPATSTQVPVADMKQVIASTPHLAKENSTKIDARVLIVERRVDG